jgi:hypothetical protein
VPVAASAVATPKRPAHLVTPQPALLTAVAWIPERDLDLAEWSHTGQRLGVMNRCSPWWLGDWIRYGNAKFGEKYSRAAKITGYDTQTLTNMVYVATHFSEISRRRENLSWSHHESVASLDPDAQDYWLNRAGEHKMSVADLRLELRSRKSDHKDKDASDLGTKSDLEAENADQHPLICPSCGQRVPGSLVLQQLKCLAAESNVGSERRQ